MYHPPNYEGAPAENVYVGDVDYCDVCGMVVYVDDYNSNHTVVKDLGLVCEDCKETISEDTNALHR